MSGDEPDVQADWRMVDMNAWRAEQEANLARMRDLAASVVEADQIRFQARNERADARAADDVQRYLRVAALNSAACLLGGTGSDMDDVLYVAERFLPWLTRDSSQSPEATP